jgi:hypothetical protein
MRPKADMPEPGIIAKYNDNGKSIQELIEEYLKIVLTQTDER